MRLLTLAYPSASEFLAAYDESTSTLVAHTKTEAIVGEQMLVEVSFPLLPNRPLLRAKVGEVLAGALRLELDDGEQSTREFLVKMARGEVPAGGAVHREHKRFPTTLPVEYQIDSTSKRSHVEDLSAGGCFVRADRSPVVGTKVDLEITVPEEDPLKLTGLVAWVRDGKDGGFGVEFDGPEGPDGRRLRVMIRRAIGTGDVDL